MKWLFLGAFRISPANRGLGPAASSSGQHVPPANGPSRVSRGNEAIIRIFFVSSLACSIVGQ